MEITLFQDSILEDGVLMVKQKINGRGKPCEKQEGFIGVNKVLMITYVTTARSQIVESLMYQAIMNKRHYM